MILKFPRGFSEYSFDFLLIFFSKFRQILLKTNTFLNFRFIFSAISQSLIDILSSFSQIPQIFFTNIYS